MRSIDQFYIVGINYKELDISEREKVVQSNLNAVVDKLFKQNKISGYVILSTCLRIEIYLFVSQSFNFDSITGLLSTNKYYQFSGQDALKYLFNVACGLDSIIIGENQILAQVKSCFQKHLDNKTTNSELNTIFNHAIAIGKKFRHETMIDSNTVSLERISVNFIKKIYRDFVNKKIFLIGTGNLIKSILYVLKKEKVKDIIITNRTGSKIDQIIDQFAITKVEFRQVYSVLKEADIVISATSAPHYIIYKDKALDYITDKKQRVFLDLAVPRDIDKGLECLDNITLFNIEDIFDTSKENKNKRKKISYKYQYLIDEQIQKCSDWFAGKIKFTCPGKQAAISK